MTTKHIYRKCKDPVKLNKYSILGFNLNFILNQYL